MLEYDSIVDDVKRSSNDFSFIDTFQEMIVNRNFKSGYQDLKNGDDTRYGFVWEVLSAIGQDVGETIYENVMNFIDRASNIDLCKTSSLRSLVKALGIDFSILDNINIFPKEIIDLIDVLSINKKYIAQTNVLKNALLSDIMDEVYKDPDITPGTVNVTLLSGLTSDQISTPGYIREIDYYAYLSGLYNTYLTHMVNLPYNTDLSAPIWWIDSRDVVEGVVDDTSYSLQMIELKRKYNIPSTFDQEEIADNIEDNKDSLDNYAGYKRYILDQVFEYRKSTLKTDTSTTEFKNTYKCGYEGSLKTRYSYYRKQKVKEYINMIQTQYNGLDDTDSLNDDLYEIDNNYFQVKDSTEFIPLIDPQKARYTSGYMSAVNTGMIEEIARKISSITIQISKIRDLIKIESQKNYTKGTFNLLAYLINEYLVQFSKSSALDDVAFTVTNIRNNLSSHVFDDVSILEYFDTTEYFNLSTDMSKYATYGDKVNTRFWESDDEINSNSGFSFTQNEIKDFYRNQLDLGDTVDDIDNFLSTVFELGAHNSYVDEDGDIVSQGLQDNIKDANSEIFLSYSGQRIGYNPYANIKNKTHASYQIHPYLYNFISYVQYEFPVINSFYNDTVIEANESDVRAQLSATIGAYGQPINVATNNQYDYSGYKSGYEAFYHGKKNRIFGYDGPFYTNAALDFLSATSTFIDSVKNMDIGTATVVTPYERYFSKLGLNQTYYNRIGLQLQTYKNDLIDILHSKTDISDVYDIYKYAEDKYQNSYILYKKYSTPNPTQDQKDSTPGQLWIRMKNHPIAFPAFYGEYPAVDTVDYFNENITYLSHIKQRIINQKTLEYERYHQLSDDVTKMSYIYDFELSPMKDTIMMAVYSKNDLSSVGAQGKYSDNITQDFYNDIQHADIIISKIEQEYDNVDKYTKLYFKSIDGGRLTKVDNYIDDDDDGKEQITGESFIGFYKDTYSLSPVFITKTYDKTTGQYSIDKDDIRISLYEYIDGKLNRTYHDLKLDFSNNGYDISSGDVKFSFYDDVLTVCFTVSPSEEDIEIQNYVGIHDDNGKTDYFSHTEGSSFDDDDNEMNSFDSMTNFIDIIDFKITNKKIDVVGNKIYNLNCDASYIPVYAGTNGLCDITQTDYKDEKYNSFEILGESKNIDGTVDIINPNANPMVDIDDIRDTYGHGMVWEDYPDYDEDKSLVQYSFSQILECPSVDEEHTGNDGYLIWNINLEKIGYTPSEFADTTVIMYNKETYGKNPYFVGTLDTLVVTNDRPFVSLVEKGTYKPSTDNREVFSNSDARISVTGTYNFFNSKVNNAETNSIFNVNDIQLFTDGKQLTVRFCPKDPDQLYFVKDKSIRLVLCNKTDIKIFQYYHFLDGDGKVQNGMINGVYLSAIELSDYNNINEVPALSGYNTLSFKYPEEEIFDLSSNFYYFPGFNMAYPSRAVDFYNQTEGGKSEYNIIDLTNLFDDKNLYCIRIDNGDMISAIGQMDIPLTYIDTDCYRGYEEYTKDGDTSVKDTTKDKYDTIDPRILQCCKFFDSCSTSTDRTVEIESEERTDQCVSRLSFSNSVDAETIEQSVFDYTSQYMRITPSKSDFQDIDDMFNIYINYRKENGGITLYFNYYNYINTPFVKMVDGVTMIDTIDGTYLKLADGEDGFLDIILQFKMYQDDQTELYGIQNVKIASYHIYNISDDKPKFMIERIRKVEKNSIVRNDSDLTIKIQTQDVYLYEMDDFDIDSELNFTVDISLNSNIEMSSVSYYVQFPSDQLICTSTSYTIQANAVKINTPNNVTLSFKTKKTYRYLETQPQYTFVVKQPSAVDQYGSVPNIKTTAGKIRFLQFTYLGKEPRLDNKFIPTESATDDYITI